MRRRMARLLHLRFRKKKSSSMDTSFDSIVRDIADQYINSVLFIDERAFSQNDSSQAEDKPTELDVAVVSRVFSNADKICCFYAPRNKDDIEKCKQLVLKPDIVVLDWNIQIKETVSPEEENQDDETDNRGSFSIQMLESIVSDAARKKLKVVFIYTGEPDLYGIIDDIANSLGESFHKDTHKFEVNSDNVHIIVRLKPDSKVSHAGFDKFRVSYEALPGEIISSFSGYVRGLMPCFAMKSLSEIRNSSARVLRVYNDELDSELLGHQLALPNPDDVRSYLANAFGSAISELIKDNPEINTDKWVDCWIDSRYSKEPTRKDFAGGSLNLSSATIRDFFDRRLSEDKLIKKINDSFSSKCNVKEEKKIIGALSSIFHTQDEDVARAKYQFASLAHNRNVFSLQSSIPVLTLGTIIRRINEKGDCFLCLQQRCDTARVTSDGMNFVFVPLYKEKMKNAFGAIAIAPNDIRYVARSSTNIILFHFTPDKGGSPIVARQIGEKFIFKSSSEEFEWVNELKEIMAQRIVSEVTSHFARVGVDEAEWIRVEASMGLESNEGN